MSDDTPRPAPSSVPSDRRQFLKKLAATTAYAAPAIKTLAAPDPASAQTLSTKMMMGGGMGMGMGMKKGWMMWMMGWKKNPWWWWDEDDDDEDD